MVNMFGLCPVYYKASLTPTRTESHNFRVRHVGSCARNQPKVLGKGTLSPQLGKVNDDEDEEVADFIKAPITTRRQASNCISVLLLIKTHRHTVSSKAFVCLRSTSDQKVDNSHEQTPTLDAHSPQPCISTSKAKSSW